MRSAAELSRLSSRKGFEPLVVGADRLRRGDLVEVEVELEAEPIFRVSTMLATLLDLFQEQPELLPEADRAELRQGVAASRVLETLLAGLVPLRVALLTSCT